MVDLAQTLNVDFSHVEYQVWPESEKFISNILYNNIISVPRSIATLVMSAIEAVACRVAADIMIESA